MQAANDAGAAYERLVRDVVLLRAAGGREGGGIGGSRRDGCRTHASAWTSGGGSATPALGRSQCLDTGGSGRIGKRVSGNRGSVAGDGNQPERSSGEGLVDDGRTDLRQLWPAAETLRQYGACQTMGVDSRTRWRRALHVRLVSTDGDAVPGLSEGSRSCAGASRERSAGHTSREGIAVDDAGAAGLDSPRSAGGEPSCPSEVYEYSWPHDEACQVAWCESRYDAGAINGSSLGVFQLWEGWGPAYGVRVADLFNVSDNVRVAYYVWRDYGGWDQWSCKPEAVN